jgi:hypothetical protein
LKRILGNLLVAVLALVALLLLIGLFLPRRYHVERSVEIRARPETVFADLTNLRRWPEWTVWNQEMDPSVKFTYDTPESGVGAGYRWTGNKLGTGKLQLTRANPTNGIDFNLDMENGKFLSTGTIRMDPSGEAVRVLWVNEGDLGKNPINRYFGLAIDSMLGEQFERGLSNLKARAEGGSPK